MLFFKSNIKKICISLVIAIFCEVIIILLFKPIISEDMNYYMPDNYVYVEQDDNNVEEKYDEYNISITKTNKLLSSSFSKILVNPYKVNEYIFLDDLAYSPSATKDMVVDVKELMNRDENIINYQLSYINFPDDIEGKTNVLIENYNIKRVIAGTFPKTDEILIDETLANYIIESRGLENYEDLIGESINLELKSCDKNIYCQDNFIISGVYQAEKIDIVQNLIVNPTQELYEELKTEQKVDEGYFVKFNDLSDKKNFLLKNSNLEVFSSEDINKIDVTVLIKGLSMLIGIIILTFLILKDILYWKKVIIFNNLSVIKYIYILNVYIIYMIISIIILNI